MIIIFDARGIVHHEFVPQGQTVNQEFYISVLRRLREALQRHPDCGHLDSGLCCMTMRDHTQLSLSVNIFLAKHNVTVLQHPLYSPDLSP
jgi:hypothetical protein